VHCAFDSESTLPTTEGLRTLYKCSNCVSVNQIGGTNGCTKRGMEMVIPRSPEHWSAMQDFVGAENMASYFQVIPGVSKPSSGYNSCGNTGPAMNSDDCLDWDATDGGAWFIRDTPFGEPNGDYQGNCLLGVNDISDITAIAFNDWNCNDYSGSQYVCSFNIPAPALPTSCAAVKAANPEAGSDYYRLDTGVGHGGVLVYCGFDSESTLPGQEGLRTYYKCSNCVSVNQVGVTNGCTKRGLEMVIPRTAEHWAAMETFVGAENMASYFQVIPGVSKNSGGASSCGNEANNMNSNECIEWVAADGGAWFIRDSPYGEPNGNYQANCFLGVNDITNVNAIAFDDWDCNFYSGSQYLCSENVPAPALPTSCSAVKAANPLASSGFYTIDTGANVGYGYDIYCDFSGSEMHSYYACEDCTSVNSRYVQDGCAKRGMQMVIPRSQDHWTKIQSFVTDNTDGTMSDYFRIIPGVYKQGSGGSSCGADGSNMNSDDCSDWRALDGGAWFIRDTPYGEPNGNYQGSCYLGVNDISDVTNIAFDDWDCNFYSGTQYICSLNGA